jgi:FkbM family methyltransferase
VLDRLTQPARVAAVKVIHEAGFVRVRETRHGAMAYPIGDQHIGRALDLYGEWAEAEVELLSLFIAPGQIVADVGANLGTHTVAFAKRVGPAGTVLAFEPQRVIHQLLCTNVALNGLTNVRAFHAAVAEKTGGLRVPPIDYAAGGNFGGVSFGQWKEGETVPVLTIDGFGLESLRLLKVDVEGMELAVLTGARATIERAQPVIYFENNGPDGSPEVVKLLRSLGYDLRWHLAPFFRPANFAQKKEDVFGGMVDANTLAVPAALAPLVQAFLPLEAESESAASALSRLQRK